MVIRGSTVSRTKSAETWCWQTEQYEEERDAMQALMGRRRWMQSYCRSQLLARKERSRGQGNQQVSSAAEAVAVGCWGTAGMPCWC